MAESAERDVVFRMHAEPASGAVDSAKKFGETIASIQERTIEAGNRQWLERLQAVDRAYDRITDSARKAAEAQSRIQSPAVAAQQRLDRLATPMPIEQRQTAAESMRPSARIAPQTGRDPQMDNRLQAERTLTRQHGQLAERRQAVIREEAQAAVAATDRAVSERIGGERDVTRATSRAAGDRTDMIERESREAVRVAERSAKQRAQLDQRRRQQENKTVKRNQKARQEEAKQAQRRFEETERMAASAQSRMNAAGGQLEEGLSSAGDALIQIGTGFAEIGILSQKNSEQLLRSLIAVRGINDVLSGGIDLWVRTSRIVEGYTLTLEAAKEAQMALNAQRALSSGGGQFVGSVAAEAAGGIAGRSGARGATGEFATDAGAAAVGTRLAGGAGLSGGAGMGALQRGALTAGRALGAFRMAATASAAPLAKFGTIAAGALSIIDMAVSAAKTGSIAPREGSIRGGVADRVGGAGLGFANIGLGQMPEGVLEARQRFMGFIPGEPVEAELNRRQTARMQTQADRAEDKRLRRRERELANLDRTNARQGIAMHREASDIRLAETPQARRREAMEAREMAQANRDAARATAEQARDATVIAEARQQAAEWADKAVQFDQQARDASADILRNKREAAQEELQASRESLRNEKETLATAEQRLEATKQRVSAIQQTIESAEVRFALMDDIEQDRLKDIVRRQQGGDELNREQLQFGLQNTVGKVQETFRKELQERAREEGVGFMGVAGLRASEDQAEAKKETLERAINAGKREIATIRNQIDVQQDVVVHLELRAEDVVDHVSEVMKEFQADTEAKLRALWQADMQQAREQELAQRNRQRAEG